MTLVLLTHSCSTNQATGTHTHIYKYVCDLLNLHIFFPYRNLKRFSTNHTKSKTKRTGRRSQGKLAGEFQDSVQVVTKDDSFKFLYTGKKSPRGA